MINEIIQRFKIHLEEDGKSVKTVESYVGVRCYNKVVTVTLIFMIQ